MWPRLSGVEATCLTQLNHSSAYHCAEARQQIDFVIRYHESLRGEGGTVASGDPDLSAGGYRR
jgi:hypothetical protein